LRLGPAGGPARIEITEAALMRDDETTLTTLRQLRDMGVRIVMDDFGTGYSSLSYLLRFPFDRSRSIALREDIAHNQNASAVVQAVTTLAKSMKVITVAEGVETERSSRKPARSAAPKYKATCSGRRNRRADRPASVAARKAATSLRPTQFRAAATC